MKKLQQILFLALSIIFLNVSSVHAGRIVLKSGNLDVLKSETKLNVQFDYSNMIVGKDLKEEDYVNKKVTEINEKKPGNGNKWKDGWINARKDRYQPKFIDLFNKQSKGNRTISENATDAKYTLIVKSPYTEPGFNIGIMKQPSRVDFVFQIIETANPATIIAELTANEIPGGQAMGYDFDAGTRIAESYAKAGKMLAKYFSDKLK